MPGPHPAVAAARLAVRRALADLPGRLVLVACSGGADSLALAAATAFVAPRAGVRAGAVVVDHQLRPGSDDDAARAAAACRDLGLAPVVVRTVDVPGGARGRGAGGPEAAARTARYAALEAAAGEAGAAAVLLGHTLDDQAETVLLALARGSGARSLSGMAPAAGLWRRPLLGLRREQTEAVCRALGLPFAVDPTNAADGPWRAADGSALRRAALRDSVLPALAAALGPGAVPALARTADQLRRDEDLLAGLAAGLLERAARPAGPAGPEDAVVLDVAVLAEAHPALRHRALHAAALAAGTTPGQLAAAHVAALDALVTDYRGQGAADLPGAVVATRSCGRLSLAR